MTRLRKPYIYHGTSGTGRPPANAADLCFFNAQNAQFPGPPSQILDLPLPGDC